jgi:hypothetical protein
MNDLGVAIPELAFEKGNTNAGIHLKVGDDATLNSKLSMNMQTRVYLNLQLAVRSASSILTSKNTSILVKQAARKQ